MTKTERNTQGSECEGKCRDCTETECAAPDGHDGFYFLDDMDTVALEDQIAQMRIAIADGEKMIVACQGRIEKQKGGTAA